MGARKEIQAAERQVTHLESLYEVGKAVARYTHVRESFPVLMPLVAKVLPIRTAVLIENRGSYKETIFWSKEQASEGEVGEAKETAKACFDQLSGSPDEVRVLDMMNSIALPLVIAIRPSFGVILFQGWPPNESDLAFVDALTNLIALALDREHSLSETAELREKYITDLEAERGVRESFVSIRSHDLRTPLTSVKMLADLIQRKPMEVDIKLIATRIQASVERMDRMIRNLLDANRIKAGEGLALKFERINLGEVIEGTIKNLASVHAGQVSFNGGTEMIGCWSRDGIERAIENLVANAIRYGYPARPVIVSMRETPDTVEISVHNEGGAISSEDLVGFFQPHRRGKSTEGSGSQGWGLGLTLVRGVAEAHGGTVKADSGEGTTFTIILPRGINVSC